MLGANYFHHHFILLDFPPAYCFILYRHKYRMYYGFYENKTNVMQLLLLKHDINLIFGSQFRLLLLAVLLSSIFTRPADRHPRLMNLSPSHLLNEPPMRVCTYFEILRPRPNYSIKIFLSPPSLTHRAQSLLLLLYVCEVGLPSRTHYCSHAYNNQYV